MDTGILLSFLLFLGFFAGVGLASMRVKQDTTDDYLVAGRGMHPALAALSAVSTWNSGYMFIGYIGFTFTMGYSIIWIGLGSMLGQIVAWAWLYKFIQQSANERGVRSLSSLVSDVTGSPEKVECLIDAPDVQQSICEVLAAVPKVNVRCHKIVTVDRESAALQLESLFVASLVSQTVRICA